MLKLIDKIISCVEESQESQLTFPRICCVCKRRGSPKFVRHVIWSLPRILIPSICVGVDNSSNDFNW